MIIVCLCSHKGKRRFEFKIRNFFFYLIYYKLIHFMFDRRWVRLTISINNYHFSTFSLFIVSYIQFTKLSEVAKRELPHYLNECKWKFSHFEVGSFTSQTYSSIEFEHETKYTDFCTYSFWLAGVNTLQISNFCKVHSNRRLEWRRILHLFYTKREKKLTHGNRQLKF